MGYSPCRLCGDNDGALELSDGVFVWPEGLRHYVVDHGVRLPQEFVSHVVTASVCPRSIRVGRAVASGIGGA